MADEAKKKGKPLPTVTSRKEQYLVAPVPAELLPMGVDPPSVGLLKERLEADEEIDLKRTIAPRGLVSTMSAGAPGAQEIMVAQMPAGRAEALKRIPNLIVEPDNPLQYQDPSPAPPAAAMVTRDPGTVTPRGVELKLTLVIQGPDGTPLPEAQVYVYGQLWPFQGTTNKNGKVTLTMFGERGDTLVGLYVKPQADYWSIYVERPQFAEGENLVSVPPLSAQLPDFPERETVGWGSKAMKVDALPSTFRGQGVNVAVIDSGAAAGHIDLTQVVRGLDMTTNPDDPQTWKTDVVGHGSHCAGVIAGSANERGILGIAPEAEVSMYKIFPGGRESDLIDAMQRCIDDQVDVINLSLGSGERSELVQHKIEMARNLGIPMIVAAGNSSGPVQYPAAFPQVLAVAAIGKLGEYPAESYHATQAAPGGKVSPEGYFSAKFTCFGPEIDVCGPGVAIVSSVPPDNYAAWDGTSMAAPHVTGLSALILAHHEDFKGRFKARNAERVARLFEILTGSAEALDLGDPTRTGAGLPNAVNAFAQASQAEQPTAPAAAGAATPSLVQLGQLVEAARLGTVSSPQAAGPPAAAPAQPAAAIGAATELGRLRELMEGAELTSRQGTAPTLKVAAAQPPAGPEQGIQALHEMMASAGL